MAVAGWLTRARSVGQSAPFAVAFLILANVVPLIGVLWFGWDVGTILIAYWLENGIIGVLNVARIMRAAGPPTTAVVKGLGKGNGNGVIAAFFAMHYGIFWLVHGMFVLMFTGRGFPRSVLDPIGAIFSEPGLLIAAAALLVSHTTSFWLNYIGRGEYRSASAGSQMWQPYPRLFALHITLVLGGIFIIGMGQPVYALLLLVVLKTAMDLVLHLREHRRAQARAAPATLIA